MARKFDLEKQLRHFELWCKLNVPGGVDDLEDQEYVDLFELYENGVIGFLADIVDKYRVIQKLDELSFFTRHAMSTKPVKYKPQKLEELYPEAIVLIGEAASQEEKQESWFNMLMNKGEDDGSNSQTQEPE